MSRRAAMEFFVGYLPIPAGHRGFLRLLVPTIIWGMCALSAFVAWRMTSSGDGEWNTADIIELRGLVSAEPYPGVLVRRGEQSSEELVLLVEEGKLPLRSGLDALAGRLAVARGTILERGGRRMLELLPGEEGLRIDPDTPAASAPPTPQAPRLSTVVVGEVVDYKCYLGAMKPGAGVTHRACAALCVQGGIPPALIVPEVNGEASVYLLATEEGARANTLALPFVGGVARVRGLVYDGPGGYQVLRIAAGGLSTP